MQNVLYFMGHGLGGFGAGDEEVGRTYHVVVSINHFFSTCSFSSLTSLVCRRWSIAQATHTAAINVTRNKSRMENFMGLEIIANNRPDRRGIYGHRDD